MLAMLLTWFVSVNGRVRFGECCSVLMAVMRRDAVRCDKVQCGAVRCRGCSVDVDPPRERRVREQWRAAGYKYYHSLYEELRP